MQKARFGSRHPTVEIQIETEKPHIIEEIHRIFGGFQHFKNMDSIFLVKNCLKFQGGLLFCAE